MHNYFKSVRTCCRGRKSISLGIRKVLGASQQSIVYLFSKEFFVLITLAFLIAGPLAYYFMDQWLQKFTYRIELNVWLFLLAALGSFIIGFLTVGYKTFRASAENPAKSIRTE